MRNISRAAIALWSLQDNEQNKALNGLVRTLIGDPDTMSDRSRSVASFAWFSPYFLLAVVFLPTPSSK